MSPIVFALLSFLVHGSMAQLGSGKTPDEILDALLKIDENERFLSYIPVGGFGNQIYGLRNAMRLAGLLNRTLIIPPLMGHGEHEIGSCHGNHVMTPEEAGYNFWFYHKSRITEESYLSIADIVDISTLNTSFVRTIDMRLFAAMRCGLDITKSLSFCAWCTPLLERINKIRAEMFDDNMTLRDRLHFCGMQFGYLHQEFVPGHKVKYSVYREQKDCRNSIFMYLRDGDGRLVAGPRNESMLWGGCPGKLSHLRDHFNMAHLIKKRREAGKSLPQYVNVVQYLGEGSEAASKTVLAIGNAFELFDLQVKTGDRFGDALSCATQYLPFHPAIKEAALDFVEEKFPEPFACVHFRGGDGPFAFVKESTLLEIKEWIQDRKREVESKRGSHVLRVFFMTDVHSPEWIDRIKSVLNGTIYEFGTELKEKESEVRKKAFSGGHGLLTNSISRADMAALQSQFWDSAIEERVLSISTKRQNVLVYVEQTICSCSQRGFFGSMLSTFAGHIISLLDGRLCRRT